MKIVLKTFDAKKIVIISSISVCLIGALITAFKIYYNKRHRKKQQQDQQEKKAVTFASKSTRSSSSSSRRKNVQIDNRPSEELLELGLHYLNHSIKCWETALDSIESAAYMQSQRLALPNKEHAELVYKLRLLLERAHNVNVDAGNRLQNSSKTLQIIQSRLELRQQQYAAALLLQNKEAAGVLPYDFNQTELRSSISSELLSYKRQSSKLSYLSDDDDDDESFVSATSEMVWIEETLEQTTFNLYRIGLEMASEKRITCRVMRTELLVCENDTDFLAKLYGIRLGFDKLLSDPVKKAWFINEGKQMVANLLVAADRDTTNFIKAYDNMINFVDTANWSLIEDELATRQVMDYTFYDIVLDFILLDAFEDLEDPPGAILAAINNRWLSQSFKETALSTAVWTVLKAKRRILKYPNGFISHFYSINEHLVPTLAWGFLGNNENLNGLCMFLKEQIVEYLKCLFSLDRTNYSNIDNLVNDIESHTIYYLQILSDKFNNK